MNSEVSGSSRSGITGMTLHERTAASKDTRSVLGRWNCPLKDRRKINHSKLSSRPGQKKKVVNPVLQRHGTGRKCSGGRKIYKGCTDTQG